MPHVNPSPPIIKRQFLNKLGSVFHGFLVLNSLVEVNLVVHPTPLMSNLSLQAAISSWLLLQFHYNGNIPNTKTRTGLLLLVYVFQLPPALTTTTTHPPARLTAIWTVLTSTIYTALSLHPSWSTHPLALSLISYAVWSLTTWILWVAGTGSLHAALPALMEGGNCWDYVYCEQLQTSFGRSFALIRPTPPLKLVVPLLAMAVLQMSVSLLPPFLLLTPAEIDWF
jgi:hypothetical protein